MAIDQDFAGAIHRFSSESVAEDVNVNLQSLGIRYTRDESGVDTLSVRHVNGVAPEAAPTAPAFQTTPIPGV